MEHMTFRAVHLPLALAAVALACMVLSALIRTASGCGPNAPIAVELNRAGESPVVVELCAGPSPVLIVGAATVGLLMLGLAMRVRK